MGFLTEFGGQEIFFPRGGFKTVVWKNNLWGRRALGFKIWLKKIFGLLWEGVFQERKSFPKEWDGVF